MTSIPDNVVLTHRDNLRGLVEKAESLIPELLERGRAPNGSFPPLESLGYVELDRGEDDLRPFVSQTLSSVLDVVTDEECTAGCYDSREPISVGALLDRLDWCVASDSVAAKRFPEWSQLNELHRLEAVCQFVTEKLQDYRLRLLEVADTEEPVLEEMVMPSTNRPPEVLTFFKPFLTVDDHEYEVTKENAVEIRDWLLDAVYALGTKLPDQQIEHMIDALHFSDGLCLVSKAQWIP
jgi:hypothetical protein